MTESSSYKLLLSFFCLYSIILLLLVMGMRDFRFQLPLSAVLRHQLLTAVQGLAVHRIGKPKTMEKSSGGNGSSFSKGKQLGSSEGT